MGRLIILLTMSVAAIGQPSVSNVRLDSVLSPAGALSHSSSRFRWNVSSQACYHRIILTNTNTGKTNSIENIGCATNDLGWPMSGLAPNTTYSYSLQSSFDGSTWSTPVTGTLTTAVLPSPHPAPPQISGLWTPTLPVTTGYQAVTMNSSCIETSPVPGNSLSQAVSTAVALQPTNGTVISIPAGTICQGFNFPNDPQILTVPATGVNTSTGVFTYNYLPSGFNFVNGQAIRVNAAACLPGAATQGNDNNSLNPNSTCYFNGPFTPGTNYYLVNVSGSTFQLALTPGGTPIIPGDQGAGMNIQQWPPQNSNWIVIQTSTPDSQFCPFGVRCMGSIWAPKMAVIQATGGVLNGSNDTVSGYFTHNIWFRGIEWTTTDVSSLANSTIDPQPSGNLVNFPYTWVTNYIVFDRNYFYGQNFPNRYATMLTIGGAYIGFLANDFENFEYWRPSATPTLLGNGVEGLSGSFSGSTLTLIPGSIKAPVNTCTSAANITFTITGGGASGTAYVYGSSAPPGFPGLACIPTLVMPTGMTATCTGSMTDSSSTSVACSVLTSASPNWPHDSSGGVDAFTLGTFTLTSGVPSGYSGQQNANQSNWATEGTQMIQHGAGPGPVTIWNNYIETTGLPWHFDDDSAIDAVGVWVRQNTFFWNQTYRMGSASSNGYEYYVRNGMEFKHGRQIKFDGNIATGSWTSVSGTSPAFLVHIGDSTPGTQTGYTIQDVDITNNTFWNHNVCFEFGGGENLGLTSSVPVAARIRIKNNVCNTNGWTQTDGNTGQAGNGGSNGNPLEIDSGIEDLIVDHNTFYDNRGTSPVIWHAEAVWLEGCQVTNNFLWFNQANYGFTSEADGNAILTPPIGGSGSTQFNSICTNDPNTPGGILSNNVAVPFYSNSGPGTPSGLVSPQSICTNFGGGTLTGNRCTGGLITTVLGGASAATNLAALGFMSTPPSPLILELRDNSPFSSGAHVATDGTNIGADVNALATAQGAVGAPTVYDIGTSMAVISWWAYDGSVACAVDYAVAPNDPSTQSGGGRATSSNGNSQSVNLTGLTTQTTYTYRVLCPVQQPTGSFLTQ
jgi:hypothetical protein